MDRVLILLVASTLITTGHAAIKCHDCSSWNPYCKEKVDAPFKNAVATIECDKTSTCFLKKDESGVINRGCADWWMESQVDIHYTGCQTQHVPWIGEMTWCFCKKDYCNGGSIDMLSKGILPEIKEFPKDEWGDYSDEEEGSKSQGSEDSGKGESSEEGSESESSKGEKQSGKKEAKRGEESGKGESEQSGKEGKGEGKRSNAESGGKENEEGESKADEVEDNKAEEEGKWSDWGKSNWKTFDDTNPGYIGGLGKTGDPKYRVWFWHADSDRPDFERDDNLWKAPDMVEAEGGTGWDFPVTGEVHDHTAEEASNEDITTVSSTSKSVRLSTGSSTSKSVRPSTGSSTSKWTSTSSTSGSSTSTSTRGTTTGTGQRSSSLDSATDTRGSQGDDVTTSAKWGLGWAHIKPWWLKDASDRKPTVKPRRWTPHPTTLPVFDDQDILGLTSKWVRGGRMVEVAEDGGNVVDANSAEDNRDDTDANSDANSGAIEDISKQEFFCWDCFSDSPLCGEKVDTVKAAYLGKSACSETNKCFVRNDGGVIYRGCADGWMNSVINTGYVGCKAQHMWGRTVEWCFCTASLCNGDSMQSIHDKYLARMEPFKGTSSPSSLLEGGLLPQSVMAAREQSAGLSKKPQTQLSPFNHLGQKTTTRRARSTEKEETTVSFRVEQETELSRVTSNTTAMTEESSSSSSTNTTNNNTYNDGNSTVWTTAPQSWLATSTGNSSTDVTMGNETLNHGFEKKTDLKALL